MDTLSRSSGHAAYDALLDAVRRGDYAPGDRLRETEVSARLGLSRTPVREALRRLESDGIVTHRPRLGAVVRSLSQTELVELYEMRMVLEATAARLAAKHGVEAEVDALEALNARIARDRATPATSAAINQEFHRGLYAMARNRFLQDAARALNHALLLLGPTTFTDPQRIEVVVAEHEALIAALRLGDGEAAAQAAERHLKTSLTHRLKGRFA